MVERATEENIRLAEVIAEANYSDQKIKMEYDRKKLEIDNLSDLSNFIEEESALVNDPLFSNSAVDECLEKLVKPAGRSLKMNLTGAREDRNQKKECQMCQKNHDLDACFKYKQLQVDERKKFLMKSKLCFGCYDVISKEHSGRNCPKRRKCSICKEQHRIELHGLQSKKSHLKKKMTTILLHSHQEMRKRKTV